MYLKNRPQTLLLIFKVNLDLNPLNLHFVRLLFLLQINY